MRQEGRGYVAAGDEFWEKVVSIGRVSECLWDHILRSRLKGRVFNEKHELAPHLPTVGKKALAPIEQLLELLCRRARDMTVICGCQKPSAFMV